MHGVRRDVALAIAAIAVLAATLVMPWRLHALVAACATLLILVVVLWIRGEHDMLKERIAGSFIGGLAGFAAVFFVVVQVGAVAAVGGAAALGLCAAGLERRRLRGAAVPVQAEAEGQVAFEGTVHAIGDPPRVPGTDMVVAMWLARHDKGRWSSKSRFEIRSEERRVLVEPEQMRVRGTVWAMGLATGNSAKEALGADTTVPRRLSTPMRVWSFKDGDHVYLIGGVTLEDDPSAPGLRDPQRISVFTRAPLIGPGRLADARQRADIRMWIWTAIAIAAGGLMATGLGGLG